jgi:hypothetical protein
MHTTSILANHCGKTAVNDTSFCPWAVNEFSVKENNSAAHIYGQLCHVYEDA